MRALSVILIAALVAGTAAACAGGDLDCLCAAAGGKWRDLKPPLEPTCTIGIRHQGGWRTFNAFLPRGYDPASRKYPVWVHLHGVYWADMDNISARMGYTVPATEATPIWDTLGNGVYRDKAIIVYPQALSPGGDAFKRTFWNLPFWHCSVGVCTDPNTDDIGFLEKMFLLLPQRLAVDPGKVFMTGTSAGGMMVENLLCSSSVISGAVSAAVDIIGGVGTPMRGKCRPANKVPFRILHGDVDPVLNFENSCEVDGAPFLGTREAAAMWKDLYGCTADANRDAFSDSTTACTSMCAQDGLLELCKMHGVGHQLDIPFRGYPFTVAWQFFNH